MPEAITLQAEGLVEDKPVPKADKKAAQIARLKAQLAALEASPSTVTTTAHATQRAAVAVAQQVATPERPSERAAREPEAKRKKDRRASA